ncbi:MAG TPA: hypothetical protein EYP14_12095, partial [Planctomycetaceae bacterium]|nr:hypothetical protein [Planctomycetaceae bacterium]
MARDVYEPCLCGSGRKLKFCCYRALSDIERIDRLLDNNQNRLALQALDDLLKKHANNRWALIHRAFLHQELGQLEEALADVERLLAIDETHPLGVILQARLRLERDGYAKSRGAIQRAFQRAGRKVRDEAASLALEIASRLRMDHPMACRRYLMLAMDLWEDEDYQLEAFLILVRLETDDSVPYPLRGPRELLSPSDESDPPEELRTALKLARVGCFDAAAGLFRKLADQSPENPLYWYNAGLCHAWDANPRRAAEALHRAAGCASDFEDAVEWETLAQLLELSLDEHKTGYVFRCVPTDSASRVISVLDEQLGWPRADLENVKG